MSKQNQDSSIIGISGKVETTEELSSEKQQEIENKITEVLIKEFGFEEDTTQVQIFDLRKGT